MEVDTDCLLTLSDVLATIPSFFESIMLFMLIINL